MKKIFKNLFALVGFATIGLSGVAQGTWNTLPNVAPHRNGGIMLLLTNGTVMCLTEYDPTNSGIGNTWDLLTPDIHGSYLNGTWTTLPAMNNTRLYGGTQVLPSGNVYMAGGEYGTGGSTGEVYNTTTNVWTLATGVPALNNISDGNSEILYNGDVLQGVQESPDWFFTGMSIDNLLYHPGTNTYDTATRCFGNHDEQSWVKLPDSSVMNVDMGTTNSERYIPQLKKWVHDATVPTELNDHRIFETGAGFLLPDGRLFFLGDSIYTAYYTPSGNASPGTWALGPQMPVVNSVQLGCTDAPAAMMPDGKILCDFSPQGTYNDPIYFYEFDYLTNTFTQIKAFNGKDTIGNNDDFTNMLDLPDGSVLVSEQYDSIYYQYVPSGNPLAAGKPTISGISGTCPNYVITGKLFNGISEGAAYGDDWQCSTNYPIVRLTDGTNVYYAKTSNWNRIGAVMTDSLPDTADFVIPQMLQATYSVYVVVNGIPSNPVLLTTNCSAGINEIAGGNNNVSVYPNPSGNGKFEIQINNGQWIMDNEKARIEVYNVLGENVFSKLSIVNYPLSIDISNQPEGVYFYRVLGETGNVIGNGKMVIEK